MKGFIITTCLFVSVLICIFLNYNYVNSLYDTMHEMISQLSNEPSEENTAIIENIKKNWKKKKSLLSISVSFREIDDLSNAIDSLFAANETKNSTQFSIYKELTQNAIDAIMRLERISIENIF